MYQVIIKKSTTGRDVEIEVLDFQNYAEACEHAQLTGAEIREFEANLVDFSIDVAETHQLMALCLDDTDDDRDIDEDVRIIKACS